MMKRVCRSCQKEYPLNEDHFYKQSTKTGKLMFYTECKACNNDRRVYNLALAKARKAYEEETKWLEGLENEIFTCKYCGEEKKISEMRVLNYQKRVTSMCLKCHRPKHKEYNEMYNANNFARVLKEKEEDIGVVEND